MVTGKKQFRTIDEYIKTFPEEVQNILKKMRQVIADAAPEAAETISYQMPTFTQNGNLVHFAAYKNHIGFYPTPPVLRHLKKNYHSTKEQKDRCNSR